MKNKEIDPKLQKVLNKYQKLRQHIGEEVEIIYLENGHTVVEKEILNNVYPFQGISYGNTYIPFIGVTLIYAIKAKDGSVIYYNSHVFSGHYYWDEKLNESIKRAFYGDEYVDKKKKRKESKDFVDPLEEKHSELIEKAFCYELKKKANSCLPLVKEELKDKFIELVNKNLENEYSRSILDVIVDSLIKLDNGASFEDVEKGFYDLSLFGASLVANAIYNYSPRGEEFKRYWNQEYIANPDYEGTVNPAILILGK